jgi:putative intracellular protease/amidase
MMARREDTRRQSGLIPRSTQLHLTSYRHDGLPEDIQAAGGLWEDSEVVVDWNLVTSRWPPDLPAFTREMMSLVDACSNRRGI